MPKELKDNFYTKKHEKKKALKKKDTKKEKQNLSAQGNFHKTRINEASSEGIDYLLGVVSSRLTTQPQPKFYPAYFQNPQLESWNDNDERENMLNFRYQEPFTTRLPSIANYPMINFIDNDAWNSLEFQTNEKIKTVKSGPNDQLWLYFEEKKNPNVEDSMYEFQQKPSTSSIRETNEWKREVLTQTKIESKENPDSKYPKNERNITSKSVKNQTKMKKLKRNKRKKLSLEDLFKSNLVHLLSKEQRQELSQLIKNNQQQKSLIDILCIKLPFICKKHKNENVVKKNLLYRDPNVKKDIKKSSSPLPFSL